MKLAILPSTTNHQKLEKVEVLSLKVSHVNVKKRLKKTQRFLAVWKSANVPNVWNSIQTHKNHYFLYKKKNKKLNVQHKRQYTFGRKFSAFWHAVPSTGINQPEPTYDTRYFISDCRVRLSFWSVRIAATNLYPMLYRVGNQHLPRAQNFMGQHFQEPKHGHF